MIAISDLIRLLAQEYGEHPSRPSPDPVSELVLTILSQNTSDVNSRRAFDSLRAAFNSWEQVAAADVEDIARAIRSGGLAQIKAARIRETLRKILAERGDLRLSFFLGELPMAQARAWLMKLPGVGPKTASCVLLFSLGKPALPVDTHVYRVARRLGLIDRRVSPAQAHELLEAMVKPEDIYRFHLYLIEHGRRVCRARSPLCPSCVLRDICPTDILKG